MLMPLAITLRFDPDSGSVLEGMWRALANAGIDTDRQQLGYVAHITLAIYPDETSVERLRTGLTRVAGSWGTLPIAMAGFGIFPDTFSILWRHQSSTPNCSRDRQNCRVSWQVCRSIRIIGLAPGCRMSPSQVLCGTLAAPSRF